MTTPCPCGSGLDYEQCCAPLHQHQHEAQTAEALMRSRYSAYVLRLDDYLLYSWHPSTRPREAFQWGPHWLGLEILQTRLGGPADRLAYVEFRARFEVNGELGQLHELSRFQRYEGRWVYVDGELEPQKSQVGRNAPCPCGSGKKYKRCCAN